MGVNGSPSPVNYLPSFNSLSLKKALSGVVSSVLSPANILESWYHLGVPVYTNISSLDVSWKS